MNESLASIATRSDASLIQPGRLFPSKQSETFTNPIIGIPSADPWMVQHNGWYYYCESRNQDSIHIRKSQTLTEIGNDEGVQVWTSPVFGPNSKAVWAPELHFINNKWYIYYAADDGLNENHRMWVLESVTEDPQGAYRCRGMLETDGWAIDGTILNHQGELYFIWSGWPGASNGKQNLYIASMSNPYTLAGPRKLLASPTLDWEMVEMPICEGPQILQRNGKTFLIYSASGSWCEDYCLGMLFLKGASPLDPGSWEKILTPVMRKHGNVHGVGHCSFVLSQDGREDWIIYHTKTKRAHGWNDRRVHAQRFTWTEEGLPHFGVPVLPGYASPIPSGAAVPLVSA
ncbi:MAG: glycoside hydrolase family 43 protein [Verrucomicrobiota bacterium]|nr:glycoside hydrolase family 43 protein [Verrucomicrobiota bacterium]